MQRPTLLIVEDNKTQQEILKEMCSRFDYDVQVVASGEEALEALGCATFAAIIMDIGLPAMDGLDCTRELRRREQGLRHTPVVALTAISIVDRERCLRAGMDDFLSKPFEPEDLRIILLRWAYQPKLPNLKILRPYETQFIRKQTKPGM
jgi:CheY-like chemotaxis protein